MSDCGCGSYDYYGDTGAYNSYCNADTPYPSISHESVPSLIDNLVNALYGAITKDVSSGKVVWNIPCDPANVPATINNIPRYAGEGLLCYIIRALNITSAAGGFVTVDGTQTLTNKTLTAPAINSATLSGTLAGGTFTSTTLTAPIINGATLSGTLSGGTFSSPTINNLTATGTLALPTGSITSAMIANGTILPADLSTGGPTWDTSGNATLAGGLNCTNLNATGTISLPSGSITGTMIASGTIVDADISSSAAIANGKLAGNPVSTNTASTIVLRDSLGGFSAGTITASLSGNASTATNATNFTASLSGDVTGTQSATSVVKINGASVPVTKTIVGTNSSGQIVDASAATLSNNTSGNAATSTTATNLAGGAAGSLPYQSGAGTTTLLGAGTSGQLLIQGASAPTWGIDHIGTSTASTTPPTGAASGYVGELLTWTSSATAITTGQTLNLLSLSSASTPSLTSGDWKFFGTIVFAATSVTIANGQAFTGGIGTTSATTTAGKRTSIIAPTYTTTSFTIEIPLALVPIYQPASAQTVYAVATAPAFTAGTMTATAYIYARRMR